MSRHTIIMALAALAVGLVFSALLTSISHMRTASASHLQRNRDAGTAPKRVICMSPAVTEIVFALGQGSRVVGISQYTTYPPEALDRPQCGAFINPNLERLFALRPDLVIAQGISEKVVEFCREHGIQSLRLEITDLESLFRAIEQTGQALQCQQEAERLCADMRRKLDAVRASVADKPRLSVFIAAGREPDSLKNLMTVSKGSFLTDIVEVAGGRNAFGDLDIAYPTISKEALLERQPQVVIELCGEGMIDAAQKSRILAAWKSLPALEAVKQGQVYAIGNTYALIPGPRVTLLAADIANILHGPADAKRQFRCADE
jgi:iron complex transport system substrate-binding protein